MAQVPDDVVKEFEQALDDEAERWLREATSEIPSVKSVRLAQVHAPKGGVSIGGKKFKGGEFIPGDVLKDATIEERDQILSGESAQPEKKSTNRLSRKFERFVTNNPLHKTEIPDRIKGLVRTSVADIVTRMPDSVSSQIDKQVTSFALASSRQLKKIRSQVMGDKPLPPGTNIAGLYAFGGGFLGIAAPQETGNAAKDRVAAKKFKGVMAHEMAHALDDSGGYSKTDEWEDAWRADIRDGKVLLSDYAKTDSEEGFAEVARAYYALGESPDSMRTAFPNVAAFFESNRLI